MARPLTAAQRQFRMRRAATKLEEASNLLIPVTAALRPDDAWLLTLRRDLLAEAMRLNRAIAEANAAREAAGRGNE